MSGDFTVSNGGSGAPATGNFGSVTISVSSTISATISFTANAPYQFVGVGFNFDTSSGGAIGTISGVPSGWSSQANPQMDGFGTFSYEFEGSGASAAVSSLTLNISGSGLSLSSFLVPSQPPAGNGTQVVGAHVFSPNLTGSGTFFAGANPSTPAAVPEPSSMLIAVLGLMGFLGYGLRRRRKA
jgi:hypothetical protein